MLQVFYCHVTKDKTTELCERFFDSPFTGAHVTVTAPVYVGRHNANVDLTQKLNQRE